MPYAVIIGQCCHFVLQAQKESRSAWVWRAALTGLLDRKSTAVAVPEQAPAHQKQSSSDRYALLLQ